MTQHWKVGDKVKSPKIERDEDEDGNPRETAPGEIGQIVHVERNGGDGYLYGVEFEVSEVWVTISDADEGPDYLIAA